MRNLRVYIGTKGGDAAAIGEGQANESKTDSQMAPITEHLLVGGSQNARSEP